jgi:hypothetical protein
MMRLVVSNELVNPVGVIYYNSGDYMLVTIGSIRRTLDGGTITDTTKIMIYISACNITLQYDFREGKSALDEFEYVCMKLLENDQLIPVKVIRKMEDDDINVISNAIELAHTILSKISAQ